MSVKVWKKVSFPRLVKTWLPLRKIMKKSAPSPPRMAERVERVALRSKVKYLSND
jgi:hypothetical protein